MSTLAMRLTLAELVLLLLAAAMLILLEYVDVEFEATVYRGEFSLNALSPSVSFDINELQ